jgi:hypothetical protein
MTKHPTIIEAAQATGLDLNEPSVAAAIEAAEQVGIEQERDRVCGHIQLGQKTGASKTAFDAIQRGLTMTPALFTAYQQAAQAHIELEARLEDDVVVEAALLNIKLPTSTHTDPAAKEVLHRLQTMLDTSADDGRIEDLEVDR